MTNAWIVSCLNLMYWPVGLLFLWGCISYLDANMTKKSAEDLKNEYWFKATKWNEKLSERTYNFYDDLVVVFLSSLFICLAMYICYLINQDTFLLQMNLFVRDIFWNVLELNVGLMTIISLVTVLKKDYYLVISVRDVLKIYKIPNTIIKEIVVSIALLILLFIQNIVDKWMSDEWRCLVSLMTVSMMLLCGYYTMCLIYKTIKLCLNDEKKELEAFRCLRFRIAYGYQIKENEKIPVYAVEKIASYLILQIKKKCKYLKNKDGVLQEVRYGSRMLPGSENTQYNKKSNRYTMIIILFITVIDVVVCWGAWCGTDDRSGKITLFVEGCVTVYIFVIGFLNNAWHGSINDRCYWTLKYGAIDSEIQSEIFAAHAIDIGERRRFDFIGSIEDLLGLYKALLYDKHGQHFTNIVVEQVKVKFESEEYQMVRDTLLLLFYYFHYEKAYDKAERKLKKHMKLSGQLRDAKTVRIINKEILKGKDLEYLEFKKCVSNMTKESVEYQWADSILMHVYKEPEYVDGIMNPEKLRNYKFEYYFNLCKNGII